MRLPQQLLPADVPTTLCAPPAWASPARARGRQLRCARTGQRALASIAARTALEGCSELARHRALEASRAHPLFADPYAEALSTQVAQLREPDALAAAYDAIATRYLDEQLMGAAQIVNTDVNAEYRQIVLLGCGMDTRPFRLPWPEGTVLYMVAPPEVHEVAEAVLAQQGAAVPRGCLLRRVRADLQGGAGFGDALERAGFRGDRLSVWGVQGLRQLGLDYEACKALFVDVTNLAAFDSLVLGELPHCTARQASNLLGEFGLLGAAVEFSDVGADFGGAWAERAAPLAPNVDAAAPPSSSQTQGMASEADGVAAAVGAPRAAAAGGECVPRLFCGVHKRLSLAQMGILEDHTNAGLETDEDFEGHFS